MPDSLMHLPTQYGKRAKIGVIVPPTNTTNEAEWNIMTPPGVTIHSARMPLHTDTSSDTGREALYRDVERYAQDLARASVDIIVYSCTAGSMVTPVTTLPDFMQAKTNTPSLTTAQSIVDALNALSVTKLSVATPYFNAMNEHEKAFLQEHGFQVLSIDGLGYGENNPEEFRNIARVNPDTVFEIARRVNHDQADAILISCTDLVSLPVIEQLETELGKPVISSNTATFWRALRMRGIADKITGFGSLLNHEHC